MDIDLSHFYLDRKQYLNNLKRKRNNSLLFDRTVNILIIGTEEGLKHESEDQFKRFNKKVLEDDKSFQKRFEKYIKKMEEEINEQ